LIDGRTVGLPAGVAHLRDGPVVLDRAFEPHLGVFPVEGDLEVTPVEAFVLGPNLAEAVVRTAEAAGVLARHAADALCPGFIRVFGDERASFFERPSPLTNDTAFFPVGRADK